MDAASDWVVSNGMALDFDGSDDYVNVPASYYGTGAISFWLKTTTEIGAALAFGTSASSSTLMYVAIGQNISGTLTNELITVATISGTARIEGYTTATRTELLDGNWHHVAVVQETANASYKIYLDGNLKTTTVGDATLTTFGIGVSGGDVIQFGSRRFQAAQGVYYTGQADDIRLYRRPLTPPEIRLLASRRGIGLQSTPRHTDYLETREKTYSVVVKSQQEHSSLSEGLVGAWCPSLGATGYRLIDRSGYGNHGTLTNMTNDDWVVSGGAGALDFDGVNDLVSCGRPILLGSGDFTISTWVYLAVIDDDQVFAGNYGTGASNLTGVQIGTTKAYTTPPLAANRFNFYLGSHLQSNFVFSATTWYHLVAVRRGGVVSLYVNGVFDISGTRSNSIGSTIAWTLGSGPNYSGEEMTGRIDDSRVYNRALTPPEIRLLASRRGIGLRSQKQTMFYQFPSGSKRRRILTGMT
jgi:hypothetical protein